MRNKLRVLIILIIISMFTSACGQAGDSPCTELTLYAVLDVANRRREVIHVPDMERINAFIENRGNPYDINWAIHLNSVRSFLITAEEAVYDTVALFDLLRIMYGAYTYFGGDEVFLPVLEEILETILRQDYWVPVLLANLLYDHLVTVINDNHFIFDNRPVALQFNHFVWDVPFDKTENGFRRQDNGLYIVEIQNHDMNDVFRLSVNDSGQFFYSVVIFRPNDEINYTLNIVYENGYEETVFLWHSLTTPAHGFGEPPSLSFKNGIPVVTIRTVLGAFYPELPGYEDAQLLMSFVDTLMYEPVIIIDIRSLPGGFGYLPRTWLQNLFGEPVPSTYLQLSALLKITPPTDIYIPAAWRQVFELVEYLELTGELTEPCERFFATLSDYHLLLGAGGMVSNERLIILLVDRFTRSAAEIFTDLMLNIENTLVIGQNTAGMLITAGGFAPLHLPNSGISFLFSAELYIWPEGTWKDGMGITPDVWVIGDALSAALALLER